MRQLEDFKNVSKIVRTICGVIFYFEPDPEMMEWAYATFITRFVKGPEKDEGDKSKQF